jgi:hypothetical protein
VTLVGTKIACGITPTTAGIARLGSGRFPGWLYWGATNGNEHSALVTQQGTGRYFYLFRDFYQFSVDLIGVATYSHSNPGAT